MGLAYSGVVIEDGLPRSVAVAWGVAEFPQRGPKRELSHEGIVEAAIEIADSEGLDAVTMQRVAAAFGFTTMALYRYIASKDELHRLMLDAAMQAEDMRGLPDQDWRAGLVAWAGALAGCYRRHAWVLQLNLDADLLIMPNNMAFVDAGLRAMRTLPLPLPDKLGVIVTCTVTVRGFMGVELDITSSAPYTPATADAIREVATTARFPDLGPLVASGVYLGEEEVREPDDAAGLGHDLTFAFTALLDGIALRAENGPPPAPPEELTPSNPREAFEIAEKQWQGVIAQRKATEQRVKDLYARESELQKAKDDAKELMKAAERYERRRARGDG